MEKDYISPKMMEVANEFYKDKKRYITPKEAVKNNKKIIEEKKVIATIMEDPKITDKPTTISKRSGVSVEKVKSILENSNFKEVLSSYGLSDEAYAQAISQKFYDHFAMDAGNDDGFIKLADMVGRMKGLFKVDLNVDVNKTPESLNLVKQIIDGDEIYASTGEDNSLK